MAEKDCGCSVCSVYPCSQHVVASIGLFFTRVQVSSLVASCSQPSTPRALRRLSTQVNHSSKFRSFLAGMAELSLFLVHNLFNCCGTNGGWSKWSAERLGCTFMQYLPNFNPGSTSQSMQTFSCGHGASMFSSCTLLHCHCKGLISSI